MMFILLLVCLVLDAMVAVLVLSSAQRAIAFSLLFVIFGLALWGVANFLADTPGTALLWNRIAFAGPLVAIIASYYFMMQLRGIKSSRLLNVVLLGGTTSMIMLVMSSYIVLDVRVRQGGGL